MENPDLQQSASARHWALAIWPAFLAACMLEGLVFSMIDPGDAHWFGHDLPVSRKGVYTTAFFCFWAIGICSSSLVLWLARPPGRRVSGTQED